MKQRKIPPILTTRDIANILGWDPQRVRRWLKREKAARKHGDGPRARYVTTIGRLMAHFPEVAWAIEADRDDQE